MFGQKKPEHNTHKQQSRSDYLQGQEGLQLQAVQVVSSPLKETRCQDHDQDTNTVSQDQFDKNSINRATRWKEKYN